MHGLTGGLVGGYRGSCACLGAARSPHLGFRSFPTWDFAFGDIPARLRRALQKAEKEQIKAQALICSFSAFCGGEGIRTPGTLTRTPVFEAGSFNHSDTPPGRIAKIEIF